MGQPCPGSKGAGAQRPPIFRDPAYAKPVTHMGQEHVSQASPTPPFQGGVGPVSPRFFGTRADANLV